MKYILVAIASICLAGGIALSMTGVANASSAPSLAATDAWLNGHLPTLASNSNGMGGSWSVNASYDVTGCTLTLTTETTLNTFSASGVIYHLQFSPAPGQAFSENDTTDAGGIIHGTASIVLSTISPSSASIQAMNADDDSYIIPPIQVSPKLLVLTFDDAAIANRVERAMVHAIMLCGGKAEAF